MTLCLLLRLHRAPYFIILIIIISVLLNSDQNLRMPQLYGILQRVLTLKNGKVFSGSSQPHVIIVYLLIIMLREFSWISKASHSFTPCTTEDATLMHLFLFPFIQVLTRCSSLLDFTGIRVLPRNFAILATLSCLLLLTKSLRPLVVFRLITICARTSISSGKTFVL